MEPTALPMPGTGRNGQTGARKRRQRGTRGPSVQTDRLWAVLPLGLSTAAAQQRGPALRWALLFRKGRAKFSQMVWQKHG